MNDAWFHAPELTEDCQTLELPEHEARHALKVRRFSTGDHIVVFNGRGDWAETVLKNENGDLEIVGTHKTTPLQPRLHLAVTLPKGERFGVLLSMVTQLGISSFMPLDCRHSVVHPTELHGVRGRRILVEACKQSRNPWLPAWEEPSTPCTLESRGKILFAHSGGASPAASVDDRANELTLLVGPEGGFSRAETAEFEDRGPRPCHWVPISCESKPPPSPWWPVCDF